MFTQKTIAIIIATAIGFATAGAAIGYSSGKSAGDVEGFARCTAENKKKSDEAMRKFFDMGQVKGLF